MKKPLKTNTKRRRRTPWVRYLPRIQALIKKGVTSPSRCREELGCGVATAVKVFDYLVKVGALEKVGSKYQIKDRSALNETHSVPSAKVRRKRRRKAEVRHSRKVELLKDLICLFGRKSDKGQILQAILVEDLCQNNAWKKELAELSKQLDSILR